MAKRCNLTNIPDQVYELMKQDAEDRRETVAQTILRVVCDRYLCRHGVGTDRKDVDTNARPTQHRHKADTPPTNGKVEKSDAERVERKKFVPPTEIEAQKEWGLKGYHFSVAEFIAHYGRQGWKLGNGRAMKDWKLTMVTWEERWKEKHGTQAGTQEYDTSGNKALMEAIKEGKGW